MPIYGVCGCGAINSFVNAVHSLDTVRTRRASVLPAPAEQIGIIRSSTFDLALNRQDKIWVVITKGLRAHSLHELERCAQAIVSQRTPDKAVL